MSYYEVFYPESVYSSGALLEISSKIIHSFFLNKKCCFSARPRLNILIFVPVLG